MSYIRGRYYAYVCSGKGDEEFIVLHGEPGFCGCGEHRKTPSVGIPLNVFDQIVMKRYNEILASCPQCHHAPYLHPATQNRLGHGVLGSVCIGPGCACERTRNELAAPRMECQ